MAMRASATRVSSDLSPSASSSGASAPVLTFKVRARALRPVAARIISYGREQRRPATLYVIRVTQSGDDDWFVARRYSEFRALHAALARLFGRGTHACCACDELGSFFPGLSFPDRHRLQSRFPFSKKKIEAQRMEELNSYLRFLVGATRGLLEDDDDDDESDGLDLSPCLALRLIREFLMTGEFGEQRAELDAAAAALRDVYANSPTAATAATNNNTVTTSSQNQADTLSATVPAHQKSLRLLRHRLSRRGSSMSSIPAHELDLVAGANKASPTSGGDDCLALSPMSNPTFADVFDDIVLLPQDAFIHRQVTENDHMPIVNPLRLIESFPRR